MQRSRRILVNSVLGLVIVGAIAGGLVILHPWGASSTSNAIQLTSTVQQGTVSSTITASGNVQPKTELSASFAASGKIATVNVALGDTVKSGQVIATLSTTSLSAQLSAAYSSLSTAQSNLSLASSELASAKIAAKATTPPASGSESVASAQQQVNSATNSVTNARSTVTEAQSNLAAATLRAPISGLVIAVNGAVGDSAGGNSGGTGSGTSGFATIADVSTLTVTANIAEADIASVSIGQAATVTFPALPDATSKATVTAIAPTATASNSVVTYATTITLGSVPASLRLGQTASVAIVTAQSSADAVSVPSAAITTANGVSTVKVVESDGTTRAVTVVLGIVGDAGTEITSGLTAGETILLGTTSSSTSTTNQNSGFTGFGGFGGGNGGFPGRGGTGNQGNNQTGGNR